jgi:hypothetical protein
MFVGSFSPNDFDQFQFDVVATTAAFKAAGVTQLLIDLTNNGGKSIHDGFAEQVYLLSLLGGFVCLGQFLHQFLAGSQIGYP